MLEHIPSDRPVDDSLQILAGHGRLVAAKLLEMTTAPSIRLSHMSDAEKPSYHGGIRSYAFDKKKRPQRGVKARWGRL